MAGQKTYIGQFRNIRILRSLLHLPDTLQPRK